MESGNVKAFKDVYSLRDLIKKYAGDEPYSVFICGPEAMYRFLKGELDKLGLPKKNIRCEMLGVTKKITEAEGFPKEAAGKEFDLFTDVVADAPVNKISEGVRKFLDYQPDAVIAVGGGSAIDSSKAIVISGTYFAPAENENRRWADVKWDYIHPCATFPTSDMVIEVPAEYTPK